MWFWNDWGGGTRTLSRHLKGCYMDLLEAQFNNGTLSLDEIKTVLGSDFGTAWPALQKKFKQDDNGLYYNERLLFEVIKRKKFSKSRRNNLNGGDSSHHMGNGNDSSLFKDNTETNQSNKQTNAHEFQKYILENCPCLSRLEKQLTPEQCEKLESEYKQEAILKIFDSMEDYKELNYKSVYRTADNWLSRDEKNLLQKEKAPAKTREEREAELAHLRKPV